MSGVDTNSIILQLRKFASERDWDQFHTVKNLVMALSVETAELQEVFQWLSPEQSNAITEDAVLKARVEEEVADVFLYLLRIVDKLDIDLETVSKRKIELNGLKYPVEKSKGSAKKYNQN
jgi:NTP pyrophosphatase (non-canonical NTP hydrolase)